MAVAGGGCRPSRHPQGLDTRTCRRLNRYAQKPLLRREISNGLYHYSSFFIAKSITSLPFQLMFVAIFNGSVYFLGRGPTEGATGTLMHDALLPLAPLAPACKA